MHRSLATLSRRFVSFPVSVSGSFPFPLGLGLTLALTLGLALALSLSLGLGLGLLAPREADAYGCNTSDHCQFIRGDHNRDCSISSADVYALMYYLNGNTAYAPQNVDAADLNDDGNITWTDYNCLYNLVYNGTYYPPAPYPSPGYDLTFDTLEPTCRYPTGVEIVSGDGQLGTAGQTLAESLVVRAYDEQGAIPQISVTFTSTSGGGSFPPSTSTTTTVFTDSTGKASVRYRLGTSPAVNIIRASVLGLKTVTFVATGAPYVATPPYEIVVQPFAHPILSNHAIAEPFTIRNNGKIVITISEVSIVQSFDCAFFSISQQPTFPATLTPGYSLSVTVSGKPTRAGDHRLDLRVVAGGVPFVHPLRFEVYDPAGADLPSSVEYTPLCGLDETRNIPIYNPAASPGPLFLYRPTATGSASLSIVHPEYPLAIEPGATYDLSVTASSSFDGSDTSAVLTIPLSTVGEVAEGEEPSGYVANHTVSISVVPRPSAWLTPDLFLMPGNTTSAAVIADPLLGLVSLTVRSHSSSLMFYDPAKGQTVSELGFVSPNQSFLVIAMGTADAAEITIHRNHDGRFLGRAFAYLGDVSVAARLYRTQTKDYLEFVRFPNGVLVRSHEFPRGTIFRGSDVVPAVSGSTVYGLFQVASGETHIYDMETGTRRYTIPSPGGPSVPGLEPVVFTLSGAPHAVSVTRSGGLTCYKVTNGQVLATYQLGAEMMEDVDLLVRGPDSTSGAPLTLFALAADGQIFALLLPDLAPAPGSEYLQPMSSARLAVDPVPMGPDGAAFMDSKGALELVYWSPAGEYTSLLRSAREPTSQTTGEPRYWDAGLPDLDIVMTSDGLYGLRFTAYGRVTIIDRGRMELDPNTVLLNLGAPPRAQALPGVDPIIARYKPSLEVSARVRTARGVVAYATGDVRLFSLDRYLDRLIPALRQDPTIGAGQPFEGWTENIDLILGPKDSSGLEQVVILRQKNGVIRVVDLVDGRLLHQTILEGPKTPVNGVDPVLTPDGRYLIDVSAGEPEDGGCKTMIRIVGVAASTYGYLAEVEAELKPPQADVDLALHQSGKWALYQDREGGFVCFDMSGKVILKRDPPRQGAESVFGVDPVLKRQWQDSDPDEDWAATEVDACPDSLADGVGPDDDDNPPPDDPGIPDDPHTPPPNYQGDPTEPGSNGPSSPPQEVVSYAEGCICVGESYELGCSGTDSVTVLSGGTGGVSHEAGATSVTGTKPGTVTVLVVHVEGNMTYKTYHTITVIAPEKLRVSYGGTTLEVKNPACCDISPDSCGGTSGEKLCLIVPCGADVRVDVFSCPPVCIDKIALNPPDHGTVADRCRRAQTPLTPVSSGQSTGTFNVGDDCLTYTFSVGCVGANGEKAGYSLGTIYVHVVDLSSISPGPVGPVVEPGIEVLFEARLCVGPACGGNKDCDSAELKQAEEDFKSQVEWSVAPPAGCGAQDVWTKVKEDGSLRAAALCEGVYTVTATLGACEATSSFEVKKKEEEPAEEQEPDGAPEAVGDPVYPHSGELVESAVDLYVEGRGLPFIWMRRYKNQVSSTSGLGRNWDFSYNERIQFRLLDGDGMLDVRHWQLLHATDYMRTGTGSLDFATPDGVFRRLRKNTDGTYSIREPGGEVHTFYGDTNDTLEGRLKSIVDAAGNQIRFYYTSGRLTSIIDTLSRTYTVGWQGDRISYVRDFAGRTVTYDYYAFGDADGGAGQLKSARSPTVTGTPSGNDFPQGKRTIYTYLAREWHPDIRDNIRSIIRPNEVGESTSPQGIVPTFQYVYGTDPDDPLTFDRVLTFTHGGTNATGRPAGGKYQFFFADLNPEAPDTDLTIERRKTTAVDRVGNITEFYFNVRFRPLRKVLYTGRADPDSRLPYPVEARSGGVRDDLIPGPGRPGPDPASYQWTYEYNRHDSLTRVVLPEGNEVYYEYAFADDPNPLVRENLTAIRYIADATRGTSLTGATGRERKVTFTYEPWTNKVASVVDERGNLSTFDGIDLDTAADSPARYTRSRRFDYQEMNTATVQSTASAWGITIPSSFIVQADLNGDGIYGPMKGNPIEETAPTTTVLSWSGAQIVQGADQQPRTVWRYNGYGLPQLEIDAELNATSYFYYPWNNPCGTNLSPVTGGSAAGGGFPSGVVRDTQLNAGRNSGSNPPLENRARYFRYDIFGHRSEEIDGRGVVTTTVWNEMDRVVARHFAARIDAGVRGAQRSEENRVEAHDYSVDYEYDYNDNVIAVHVENADSGTSAENPTFDQWLDYDILDRLIEKKVEVKAGTLAVWEYFYDSSENLIAVRYPERNEDHFTYDERDLPHERIEGASDPDAGRRSVTRRAYDKNGNLRFFIDAEDNDGDGLPEVTEYVYDGWDRMKLAYDPAGQRVQAYYDIVGNVSRLYVYGTSGGPTPRRSDSPSLSTLRRLYYSFDEQNRKVRVDESILGSYSSGLGLVEGPVSPGDSKVTSLWEYDRLGRITRGVNDRGAERLLSYNGLGQVLRLETVPVHGNRNRLERYFDRAGNPYRFVETEALPGGATETYQSFVLSDALSRKARFTDPAGQTTYLAYDSRGYLTVAADAQGPLTNDPTGLFLGPINSPGNTVRRLTDGLGRVYEKYSDLCLAGQGSGLPDFSTPPNPAQAPASGFLDRTAANPDGIITELFAYDGNGRLRSTADDRGNTTEFHYDHHNRLVRQIFADLTAWDFNYDRDHHKTYEADPRNVTKDFHYDGLDRMIAVEAHIQGAQGVKGSTLTQTEWDGLNRPTYLFDNNEESTAADDHEIELAYDSFGNRLREIQDGLEVSKQYDSSGNPVKTVHPGGSKSISQVFDLLNRSTDVTLDGYGLLRHVDYAGPGARPKAATVGALQATYRYDSKRRLETVEMLRGTTMAFGRGYAYDRKDVPVTERSLERPFGSGYYWGRVYSTDSQTRLTDASADTLISSSGVAVSFPAGYSWELDGAGNWTSATTPTGGTRARTFGPLNEEADGDFDYDANGNRSRDPQYQYHHDAFGRLVEVWDQSHSQRLESYTYDCLSRRVTRTVHSGSSSTTTRLVYDGPHVVEERSGQTVVARNYYGARLDDVVARESSYGLHWFLKDAAGSVGALSDSGGNVLERYEYTPFGEVTFLSANRTVLAGSAYGNPYLFQSHRRDATGLYDFRYRFYDPRQGRFLELDPYRDPYNFGNLYNFPANNPLAYTDPWGLGLGGDILNGLIELGKAGVELIGGFVEGVGEAAVGLLETAYEAIADPFGSAERAWDALVAIGGTAYAVITDPEERRVVLNYIQKRLRNLSVRDIGRGLGNAAFDAALGGGLRRLGQARKLAEGVRDARRGMTAGGAGRGACGRATSGCFLAGTLVLTTMGAVPVEGIDVGQRVVAEVPRLDEERAAEQAEQATQATQEGGQGEELQPDLRASAAYGACWKILRGVLRDSADPAHPFRLSLLRTEEWVSRFYDPETRTARLELEETGIEGIFHVDTIEEPASLEEGPGWLVTAVMSHRNALACELRVEGSDEVVKTTTYHPFFSVDREGWIPAGELKPGERIESRAGVLVVDSVTRLPGTYRVFNMEVEGSHAYHVGKLGILAHNYDGAGKSAEARAKEIHDALSGKTRDKTTVAVTETAEGPRVVSSSEDRLRPAQREMLGPGEVEGAGPGHAEVTGVNAAEGMGLTPTGTAASRPICEPCADFLASKGVAPLSPLKGQ